MTTTTTPQHTQQQEANELEAWRAELYYHLDMMAGCMRVGDYDGYFWHSRKCDVINQVIYTMGESPF